MTTSTLFFAAVAGPSPLRRSLPLVAAAVVAACGGGGGDDPPPGPSSADRSAAAATTAQSTTNQCAPVKPFYWEVGDKNAKLASGSVTSTTDPTVYTSATVMNIASASKWLYSSYVVEKRAGVLSASDIKFLNFQSGYTNFFTCLPSQTVQQCVDFGNNGVYDASTDGKFDYDGGHMEKHASLIGLGALDNGTLAAELHSQLGSDVAFTYAQPQLAGGIDTSADDYARFLRKIVGGSLKMHDALGSHPVCTNPATCAASAFSPTPSNVSWHYSIGHWVEDDPSLGDGAFSSPGLFGFYPWIDAGRTTYGIVARHLLNSEATQGSVVCGQLIRKAWMTATPQ